MGVGLSVREALSHNEVLQFRHLRCDYCKVELPNPAGFLVLSCGHVICGPWFANRVDPVLCLAHEKADKSKTCPVVNCGRRIEERRSKVEPEEIIKLLWKILATQMRKPCSIVERAHIEQNVTTTPNSNYKVEAGSAERNVTMAPPISPVNGHDRTHPSDPVYDKSHQVAFQTELNVNEEFPPHNNKNQCTNNTQENDLLNFLLQANQFSGIIDRFEVTDIFSSGNMIVVPITNFSQITEFLKLNSKVPNMRLESKPVSIDIDGKVLVVNLLVQLNLESGRVIIGTYLKLQSERPETYQVDIYISKSEEIEKKSIQIVSDLEPKSYTGFKNKISNLELKKFLDHEDTLKIGVRILPA